jgi:hypothetical protein
MLNDSPGGSGGWILKAELIQTLNLSFFVCVSATLMFGTGQEPNVKVGST